MQKLLETIVNGLVDNKEAVSITCTEETAETVIYHINVAEQDMGRIIGKQGRVAKAIRTVARAASVKYNKKVMVEIG